MIAEGAMGSDDDFAAVLDYLVLNFGRVNVNHAPAPEMATVLHIDLTDAERLSVYRKEHGPFADFAALVSVPGAPVEALTKRRDALVF
jgi:DNA uptake protein ComE-like DNA-binding protein